MAGIQPALPAGLVALWLLVLEGAVRVVVGATEAAVRPGLEPTPIPWRGW